MSEILISADINYVVSVGCEWKRELQQIREKYSQILLLVPERLVELLDIKSQLSSGVTLHTLPDGEEQKSVETLNSIWSACGSNQISRMDAIVAIGGGATTDVAGFAAATWLRGIDWFAFPTSLAGMVDAAIGGKTGINTELGKNLVGAFYSPKKVLIDFSFLKSLDERDINAGMAEIIKCGFISDKKILTLANNFEMNQSELIERAIAVKAKVVSLDFKEGKLREILNYGHTLGHAIEKLEGFKWRHGEAVSIGLVFAAELSSLKSGLDSRIVELHRDLLRKYSLPISYPRAAKEKLIEFMASDKKVRDSKIRFIGISDLENPVWLEDVTSNSISEAYERISS